MKRKQHRIIAFILAFITVILMGCSSTSYHNDLTEKPVIYLYPEDITEVSVQLEYSGELTCSYPQYQNGWNVTAYTDGKLINH